MSSPDRCESLVEIPGILLYNEKKMSGEDEMKIENKEMLLYSMNKALEELQETLVQSKSDRKEIYYRLGTCLH